MKLCRLILAGAALLIGAADAPPVLPPEATAQLDAVLARLMDSHNLPSLVVGVAIPGHSPYSFVRGKADLQTGGSRSEDQPFRIASLTKTFTATAILLLVDRGKLRVTDPLSAWFPDFPNASTITIDDLLRMRSGIAADSDEQLAATTYDDPLAAAPDLSQRMAVAAKQRERFKAPGQVGEYLNLNYFILGGVIAKLTGQPAGAFITEHIIDKLGLTQTSFPDTDALPGGLHGYGRNKDNEFEDKTLFNPALAGTAGAMISTVSDLLRYGRVLCTGGLLEPDTQRARMRGQTLAGGTTQYGEGVITGPGACGHSGTIPGFSTDMYHVAEFDAEIVVNANRLDRDDALQTTPAVTAAYTALQAEFRPGAYCRRVHDDATLHPLSAALRPGVQAAFGVPAAALAGKASGVWRCVGEHVLACITGANLPCGKIETTVSIPPAVENWCREHPDSAVPLVVTGSASLWRWACHGAEAARAEQQWKLDSGGFAATRWKPISVAESGGSP